MGLRTEHHCVNAMDLFLIRQTSGDYIPLKLTQRHGHFLNLTMSNTGFTYVTGLRISVI